MKSKFLTWAMLLAMFSVGAASCDDDDDDEPTGPKKQETEKADDTLTFVGRMVVEYNDKTVPSDSVVVLTSYDSLGRLNIDFKGVRFSPQMPMTIDLTVPGVSCQQADGVVTFQSDSIVPMMGTKPAPMYVAHDLKGEMRGDSLSFTLYFADFHTTYNGLAAKGKDDSKEDGKGEAGGKEKEQSAKSDTVPYLGLMSVEYNGQTVQTEAVSILTSHNPEGGLNLDFMGVKFVPQMPLTLDITVPGVPFQKEGDVVAFQADSIVPTMGGMPVERYMARGLKGEVRGDTLSFTVTFADYPTTYKGVAVNE